MKAKSLLSILLSLLFLSCIDGQSKKSMSIIDFLNIPNLNNAKLSPDGKRFVYLLSESDWKENKQVGHIWRQDVSGTNRLQLTNGSKGESNPSWSPDGKYISFAAKRDKDEEIQVYLIMNMGGEAMRLTNHPASVRNIQWSPDAQSIYFLASDEKSKAWKKRQQLNDDVYAFDENYTHRHLWKMSLSDSAATRISDGDYSINSYELSKDGSTILFSRSISPLLGDRYEGELWLMKGDGTNATQLTDNDIPESSSSLSADGKQVLFTAGVNEKLEDYYDTNLFLFLASGGQPSLQLGDSKYGVSDANWTGDGKSIYLLMNMGSQRQLFKYTLSSKKLSQLTNGDHTIGQWHYNSNLDQHIFSINNWKNPGDLYLMKGTDFKSKVRLTNVYDYMDEDFLMPKQEVISWKGADGVNVEGILYYPANYSSGTRYPLVVQTHGGPKSSDTYGISKSHSRYNPVLTGKGYLVLQPNYRGSTGYGDDFVRDMVGSYFRNSHLDVMAGVDYLIERGLADSDRLIKMGWSAGGHMTNKIVTFTDRFKAASSGAGAVNWIGMYAQSDVRVNRTPWFGGTPWQENAPIDVYWNNSPLKDIYKVKTPTLVIVGGSDPRVPPPQSVEFYRALKSNNVPTHLYIAPREPHGWRELRHRLYKMNVELDWFAKYALNTKYTWEAHPSDESEEE